MSSLSFHYIQLKNSKFQIGNSQINKSWFLNFRKELPQERATSREKGQPLCMEQYYRLLTSYRVPAIPKDQIFSTLYQEIGTSEHIIIIHKNQVRMRNKYPKMWFIDQA